MATAITNGSGARSTPGAMWVVYSPAQKFCSLTLFNGYRNNLCPQSKIQNTLMRGIKDLYLKITIQQTRQNIS